MSRVRRLLSLTVLSFGTVLSLVFFQLALFLADSEMEEKLREVDV